MDSYDACLLHKQCKAALLPFQRAVGVWYLKSLIVVAKKIFALSLLSGAAAIIYIAFSLTHQQYDAIPIPRQLLRSNY